MLAGEQSVGIKNLNYGDLYGGIPFVSWGKGNKKLVIFAGGPGNSVPGKFVIQNFYREFDPFTDKFTIFLVARKKNQPEGYSTKDMSDDYAKMIGHDFKGHVDLIVGTSYGGMIAQHFAADHPGLFDHIVIALAAHKVSEIGKEIDNQFAEFLSQGRTRKAYALIADALYPPGLSKFVYKVAFWLLGRILSGQMHESFRKDVLVEARAEMRHAALASLERIQVPVLIICGDEDVYFPKEYTLEMAGLIKGSILKLYKGKGHMGTLEDQAFAKDIFEFIDSEN
jgi:pimeloyl-ACP methyl ester carboxylesterase